MAKPEDSVQYSYPDLLDGHDPRAQAFTEENARASHSSAEEVIDNWARRVSPLVSPSKYGKPLFPGDDDPMLQDPDRSNENITGEVPADNMAGRILGCPTIMRDGRVCLQGYASAQSIEGNETYVQGSVSSEPKDAGAANGAPRGIQSVEDIEQVGVGVARGLTKAGQEYLEFLSQPNAVNKGIAYTVEAAATAVDYYSTHPERIATDVQAVGQQAEQMLVDKLGHPLTPEQAGELAGEMMTVFIPIGRARALTDGEIEALGGVQKLEQMSAEELKEQFNLKRPAKIGPWTGAYTEENVVAKVREYLLDLEHKDGGGKAKFLHEVLGFNQENMGALVEQLKFDPAKAVFKENTPYGTTYKQTIRITGINGEIRELPFVWIRNPDNVVRLVTLRKIPKKLRL